MMKYDCPNSQNAKNSAIVYSRFVPSMYQRGNFTPAKNGDGNSENHGLEKDAEERIGKAEDPCLPRLRNRRT